MDDQNKKDRPMNGAHVQVEPMLWGGIECSINRVQDRFQDQLEMSGHYLRDSDIDLIADLGIRALRYPVLWEKHQPAREKSPDFSWAEKNISLITEQHITPIVGLVHHGSGPGWTSLHDDQFAVGLANYAREVARKFPFLSYYTPINEPLTTARFSGLYGLWFPHHSSDRSFCRILVNELKAVVLSMQAIREINPDAKLVQTEDLAKIYATSHLQYQADFENERRWITYDFLCGRVTRNHYLWKYFLDNGISEKELNFFQENHCIPDILGHNYYVTSERFLDHRIWNYSSHLHGGNNRESYVDTEAIRIDHGNPSGLALLLNEAWDRYSLPMAMTEVHLHCTIDEQMRWFMDVWNTCKTLVQEGIDIRAVTAWSIFGAYGWNQLLTAETWDYEAGIYDLRNGRPQATEMVSLLQEIARTGHYHHEFLTHPGWWKSESRFLPHIQRTYMEFEEGRA